MAIQQGDAISAREGTVFATIDGETFEFGEIKNIDAFVNVNLASVTAIGQRMEGSKATSAEGTGSMVFHIFNNRIRNLIINFVKTGYYPEISIKAANADVTSRAGRQTVLLKGVLFESTKLFELDGDSDDTLEDETDFRFNDVDILESYKVITN